METYNYQKLNQIINMQYIKIITEEEKQRIKNDKNYQIKLKEQEKSNDFYKNLIRTYNNPSFENLISSAKIASTINQVEPQKDDRSKYIYIDKNYT
jgi:hypothetical protein